MNLINNFCVIISICLSIFFTGFTASANQASNHAQQKNMNVMDESSPTNVPQNNEFNVTNNDINNTTNSTNNNPTIQNNNSELNANSVSNQNQIVTQNNNGSGFLTKYFTYISTIAILIFGFLFVILYKRKLF